MKKLEPIPCGFCRVAFQPRASTTRFCSRKYTDNEQRERAIRNGSRVVLKCLNCQKDFSVWVSTRSHKNTFCSDPCYVAYKRKDHVSKKCKMCGKVSLFKPRKANPALTRDYCSRKCYMNDPLTQARLSCLNRDQQLGKETSVERMGYALLTECGVVFERQAQLEKFCVDAFIPALKIVVQFDGDYWHGHSSFEPLNKIQRRNRQRDGAMDAYLLKCGYTIFRVWGSDLKQNRENVKGLLHSLVRSRA